MRIGIICHASCGGSSKIAIELAKQLSYRHEIYLFSLHKPFFKDNQMVFEKSTLQSIELLNSCNYFPSVLTLNWTEGHLNRFIEKIIDVTLEKRLEILHFHYIIPFASVAHTIKNFLKDNSPALIGTFHGTDVSMHQHYARQLIPILPVMDALTTVSEVFADLAKSVYLLPQKPLVIPNFIDTNKFKMNPTNNHLKKPYKFIHVSNFRPIKNPLQMAKIFMQIQKNLPTRLCLVGDGPLLPDIKEFFYKNKLDSKVEYHGLQTQVASFFEDAHLFLMSSLSESFCLSALEAMASGIPIIAPDVGGLPELVKTGKHGFLYAVDDVESAAKLATYLLKNEEQYTLFRKQANERANEFDQKKIIPKYEELYVKTLKQKAR